MLLDQLQQALVSTLQTAFDERGLPVLVECQPRKNHIGYSFYCHYQDRTIRSVLYYSHTFETLQWAQIEWSLPQPNGSMQRLFTPQLYRYYHLQQLGGQPNLTRLPC